MPTDLILWGCEETVGAIERIATPRGAVSFHKTRGWILFLCMAIFLWSSDARAQIEDLPGEELTIASLRNDLSRKSGIIDTVPRYDFSDPAVSTSAGEAAPSEALGEASLGAEGTGATSYTSTATAQPPKPRFQTRTALRQEFEYLLVEHAFRLSQDADLRFRMSHSPFFHNWVASFEGYDLKRWGDGDSFLVNDIAHPMQGAIASWIFIQNSPMASSRVIGKDPQYWTSRLKGMAWAAAYEVQWKIGPLSESSIGNAGGWEYVPGCGIEKKCENNPKYPKEPTNNTGLSDWIVTPLVGTGWVMLEDTIDKYVVRKVGEKNRLSGIILRSALEPCRNFAELFAGRAPWDPPSKERHFVRSKPLSAGTFDDESSWRRNRRSVGVSIVNLSLPGVQSNCIGCRENHVGIGFPYSYRILEHLYFDSETSYFANGSSQGNPSIQGLFGARFGSQAKSWGLFGRVRPGFIYYRNAWSGGESPHFTDLSRFALDAGGTLELYPSRRSTIRVDFGTTLVRYLRDCAFPRVSPFESSISRDYYSTQGNFQISTGYRFRF